MPAPVVRSKPMVRWPLLRKRAALEPVLTSELLVPISASLKFQTPVPRVTLAAAYDVLVPASNPSLNTLPA